MLYRGDPCMRRGASCLFFFLCQKLTNLLLEPRVLKENPFESGIVIVSLGNSRELSMQFRHSFLVSSQFGV